MIGNIKRLIKGAFGVLANPERAFKGLQKRSLEDVLKDYIYLLITVGVVAGVVGFVYFLGKAVYLDIFYVVEIKYLNLINYGVGRLLSIIFFYIFSGTFLLFLVSLVLKLFVRKVKLTVLIKILLYAMMPLLMFSWIPLSAFMLGLWSLFLFVVGVKEYRQAGPTKKDSIQQRD